MTIERSTKIMKFAAIVFIAFGLLSALAAWPPLAGPQQFLAQLIFMDFDGSVTITTQSERLLSAILGGMITALGVILWQLTDKLYQDNPALISRIIISSLLTWYVIDSAASAVAGAPLNFIGNLGFLALFLIPLMHAKPDQTTANLSL